jgi:hypothetical protein
MHIKTYAGTQPFEANYMYSGSWKQYLDVIMYILSPLISLALASPYDFNLAAKLESHCDVGENSISIQHKKDHSRIFID